MITHEKVIKDLIDFITKFEIWLEAEGDKSYPRNEFNCGYVQAIEDVLEQYWECKKRIEDDEQ